jgi:hypothetical protein
MITIFVVLIIYLVIVYGIFLLFSHFIDFMVNYR